MITATLNPLRVGVLQLLIEPDRIRIQFNGDAASPKFSRHFKGVGNPVSIEQSH